MSADPFWADGVALASFLGSIAEGRYKPEIFNGQANIVDGRNVSAIALEIPDDVLGNRALSIWARISRGASHQDGQLEAGGCSLLAKQQTQPLCRAEANSSGLTCGSARLRPRSA